MPVDYLDGIVPEAGAEVTSRQRLLGRTGTGAAGRGLAMIRLDRAQDALAAGKTIAGGGLALRLRKPGWIRFPFPGEAVTQARK